MNPQQPHTLPEGWEMKRLEEVSAKPIVYGIVQAGPHIADGMPYIKSSDLSGEKLELASLQRTSYEIAKKYKRSETLPGDIVFSLRGNIGVSQILPAEINEANLTQGTARISVKKDVKNQFVKYALESPELQKRISEVAKGSTFKEISIEEHRRTEIPLPPLPEQRRIAAVLGTWDQAIEQTIELIKQLRTRHRGLMQRLLTGKVRLPGFNGEWQAVKLGNVFKERSQIGYHNLPLLSITAELGVINRDELVKRDTSNEDKSKYKRICPGDIVYNTMRMWQGRSAVSSLEGIVSPAYTIVTPKSNADIQFMGHLFKFPNMIHRFYRNSQGLVDDTLNCKFPEFAKVRVSIPPTLDEQRAIAQILDASLREIRQQEAKLNALREQKRGLMQCLLTGQVRVPVETARETV